MKSTESWQLVATKLQKNTAKQVVANANSEAVLACLVLVKWVSELLVRAAYLQEQKKWIVDPSSATWLQ